MLSIFEKDVATVPQTFQYKLEEGLLTLADQEEALTEPGKAYGFSYWVNGADLVKCQEVACQDFIWAYSFWKHIIKATPIVCAKAAWADFNILHWETFSDQDLGYAIIGSGQDLIYETDMLTWHLPEHNEG